MALTFNPREAVQKLRENGMDEPLAGATVEVVEAATGALVTREHFDATIAGLEARFEAQDARFEAKLYRALWVFGGGIVTINAAIVTAVVTISQVLN